MPDTTQSFGFPKQQPQFYTELLLSEYKRPKPGANITTSLGLYARLPLPSQLTDSYNMDINSTNLDLLGNIDFNKLDIPSVGDLVAAGTSVSESISKAYGESGGIKNMVKGVVAFAAALTPGISDTGIGKAAQLQSGMVRNPHLTTMFDGVKLRNFQFTWRLSPKSADEAREMNDMIMSIKALMHPQLIYGGFALEYPYLAKVNFITGDSSKSIMPNVGLSFITAFEVNSLSSGTPAFYNDGQPVSIEIGMGFQEINIKTRDDFKNNSALG
jgi:hypothetical protein